MTPAPTNPRDQSVVMTPATRIGGAGPAGPPSADSPPGHPFTAGKKLRYAN